MIPGSANSLLLASAAGAAGYVVERSIRLNSADSAYLSRTPSTAGNRKTWTWAGWVKRSGFGTFQTLFGSGPTLTDTTYAQFGFDTADKLVILAYSFYWRITTQVFRDPSAWFHVVVAFDTTQATAANRIKLYINGTQVTTFSTSVDPSLNQDLGININAEHRIGNHAAASPAYYFNGYLADIHFIDGQALTPSSFGYADSNGIWQPKAYTGSYPGNSFHLDFADNSAASTAGIGKDASGNGNDWTPNNLSVAAGAGNDSLVDTPTNYGTDTGAGGEVRGNYATWTALSGTGTLANGNLDVTGTIYRTATIGVTSGKWYCEITAGSVATNSYVGIYGDPNSIATYALWGTGGYFAAGVGSPTNNFSSGTITAGDVIGVAFDYANGTLGIYRNGSFLGQYSGLALGSGPWFIGMHTNASAASPWTLNAGQRSFVYQNLGTNRPNSDYKALCTQNLSSTTITTSGSYTGNGSADGPFVYLNGVPTAMTVNGNAVTFGTEADKLSNGFKVRTASTTYNQNAATYNYSITSTGDPFKVARAQSNP